MWKFIKLVIGKLVKYAVILCVIGVLFTLLYSIFKPIIEEKDIPVLSSIDSMYEAYLGDEYLPMSNEAGMKIVRKEIERLTNSKTIVIDGQPMSLKVGKIFATDHKPIQNIKDTIIHDGYINFISFINGQEQHDVLVTCKWDEENQTIKITNKTNFWEGWIQSCVHHDFEKYVRKNYGKYTGSQGPGEFGEITVNSIDYNLSIIYKYRGTIWGDHLFKDNILEITRTIYKD